MTATTCVPGDRIRVRILGGLLDGDVVHVGPDDKITLRVDAYTFDMLVYPHEVVCKLAKPAPAAAAAADQEARHE